MPNLLPSAQISKDDVASGITFAGAGGVSGALLLGCWAQDPSQSCSRNGRSGDTGLRQLTEMGKCSRTQKATQGEFQGLGRYHCP